MNNLTIPQLETKRLVRIRELLGLDDDATQGPNDWDLPSAPGRYFAIEFCLGDPMWAFDDDTLAGIAEQLDMSDTERDSIIAWDLDEDIRFSVQERVSQFYACDGQSLHIGGPDFEEAICECGRPEEDCATFDDLEAQHGDR